MQNDRIEVGDIVKVDINQAMITLIPRAEVLHKPVATGDSWVFKRIIRTGNPDILYVSEGCTIELLEKRDSETDF